MVGIYIFILTVYLYLDFIGYYLYAIFKYRLMSGFCISIIISISFYS